MSGPSALVTLDGEVHDPSRPLLFADDLAAVRGDGVFETLLVRDGHACLVESHLYRLVQSAKTMDLPEPDLPAWHHAIGIALGQWNSATAGEGALRLVYSRGRESNPAPTAYLTVNPLPERVAITRREGIAAVVLSRGLSTNAADAMPWLVAGAKTLSYAVNMAALRHGTAQGAGDVIFVSSDGYLLEGPRSTVVIAADDGSGGTCFLTPPPWYPILRGTTQQALFQVARDKGYDCDFRALRPSDLLTAQGVWLVSSITLAARVHTLDGQPLPPTRLAAEVAALVDAAIVCDR
ncbi:aminodeoxychorismate lyase [Mycolicibacterium sarraceniae]|uniref:4-amino-4-deoxychorismate lyase n=1 Tax=Mycolicibacterium sarraceniae TaxID=1534348 RepID=A0A7I7SN13_9MYCO|nr:aminodeoxychorismate lyase [Mycolicibacterium sarraceniae]BBY57821.1 4-amino-4-deoxychorismate lyase [Mycolicibacterium sarraceniae]